MKYDTVELGIQEWRSEVNFLRLLSQCEKMASNKDCHYNWRLELFVGFLEEQLTKLKKMSANQPKDESLLLYASRLNFLQVLLQAEKLKSISLKSQTVDKISEPAFIPSSDLTSTENQLTTRQLHSQIRSQLHENVQNELFSKKKDSHIVLRNRKEFGNVNQSEDMVKYHQQIQEKLAEEMVQFARNLRENVSTAGKILKQDNEKLIEANELAGINIDQLKIESERLERYLASACNCWLWVAMLIVCITFVSMVIFMKLFPKKYL